MNESTIPVQSLSRQLISTFSALIIAGITLITAVLPAEYGIDPTGLGKAMGLTALAAPSEAAVISDLDDTVAQTQDKAKIKLSQPLTATEPITAQVDTLLGFSAITATEKTGDLPLNAAAKINAPVSTQPIASGWKDSVNITVPGKSGVEYKFTMNKDGKMHYAWKTDGGRLYYDFHGEPAGDKTGYFKSFATKTGNAANGELIAPFTGVHGWYWENNSRLPVTITLQTKGDYQIKGLIK